MFPRLSTRRLRADHAARLHASPARATSWTRPPRASGGACRGGNDSRQTDEHPAPAGGLVRGRSPPTRSTASQPHSPGSSPAERRRFLVGPAPGESLDSSAAGGWPSGPSSATSSTPRSTITYGVFIFHLHQELGWSRGAGGCHLPGVAPADLISPYPGVVRRPPRQSPACWCGAALTGRDSFLLATIAESLAVLPVSVGGAGGGRAVLSPMIMNITLNQWFVERRGRALAFSRLGDTLGSGHHAGGGGGY